MKHRWAAGFVLFFLGCASSTSDDAGSAEQRESVEPAPSLPRDFDALPAKDKLATLWDQRIVPSTYATKPEWKSVSVLKLFKPELFDSFTRTADERTGGRKLVHAFGSVVKVEYVAEPGSPYTGLYKGGEGIARLSLANSPDDSEHGFVPGFAMKILADGKPSGNLLVMFTVDGQQSHDFFANTFSNQIPDATTFAGKLVSGIFSRVQSPPSHLGIAQFAAYDRRGRVEAAPVAPQQVFFVPAASVKAVPRHSAPDFDLREDLEAIPEGTTLYDVQATRNGEPPVKIGRVLTKSAVIASKFGDENLFFKHNAP